MSAERCPRHPSQMADDCKLCDRLIANAEFEREAPGIPDALDPYEHYPPGWDEE